MQPILRFVFLLLGGLAVVGQWMEGRAESAMLVDPSAVQIEGDLATFTSSWQWTSPAEGIQIGRLSIEASQPSTPPKFSIRWRFPSVRISGFWHPGAGVDKTTYWGRRLSVSSRAATLAPVLSFFDTSDENRLTIAASDALNLVETRCSLREEDALFYCSVGLMGEPLPKLTRYAIELRLDSRTVAFHKALADVASWWSAMPAYQPAPVPEAAREPLYSTWYNFHQSVDPETILEELKIAKEIGLKGIIVDDGWQTLDAQRGYAYTGDWIPERVPQMRDFVDQVHDLGLKFVLWYSVPFVGKNATNFDKFEGKYLRYWESQGAYVLDPRYPEVREFVIGTYEKALREWDLDGFKLDFIDRFVADDTTVLTAEDGRDYASVNAALDRLMTDVMARLRKIRPDIMIEFRQPYIGPLMRKYGNMFRASDCPNNAVLNRIRIADLRALSGGTAVHSDMFMWHPQEQVDQAALQLLNVLFSVPQVSVRLAEVSPEHRKMLAFWVSYWNEHRDVLLDGEFTLSEPQSSYPILSAHKNGTRIVTIYGEWVVSVPGADTSMLHVVNAKGSSDVVIDLVTPMGDVSIRIYSSLGELIQENSRQLRRGPLKLQVPSSGLLVIEKR